MVILLIRFAYFIDYLYPVLQMHLNCVSAFVSTEDNNDIVNIKSTACNCIVDAHLTKLAISIFLGKIEGNL